MFILYLEILAREGQQFHESWINGTIPHFQPSMNKELKFVYEFFRVL